ncbi:MAG: hypothetical protein U1C57_02185, partial [Candidatus Doudnabacteria bacterium]|nr:hypothetical protein [Candidatus Doudnabacteria bacterium]
MKSEIINIKTEPETKRKAKKLASDLGLSLGTLLNAYLKQFIKTKTVTFGIAAEEPSEWLINELKQAEKDEKNGYTSPAFDNAKDAIAWLNDPK